MKKRILIYIGVVFAFAGLVLLMTFIMSNKNKPSDNDPVDTLVTPEPPVTPTTVPEPTSTPEPTVQPTERPTIDFEDDIKVNITGSDYLDADNIGGGSMGLTTVEEYYGIHIDYGFSNGFYLLENGRYTPLLLGEGVGGFDTGFGVKMTIKELNPLQETIDSKRALLFDNYGLSDYLLLDGAEVTKDAPVKLGEGYEGWQDIWNGCNEDPTISDSYQLIADYKDDCSYGEVSWFVFYQPDFGKMTGYAIVTCDRDRLLQVQIEGTALSDMWSAFIEVTNDLIRIVS